MFLLYNVVLTLLMPIWFPWMLVRTWRRKEPVKWNERWGNYDFKPRKDRKRIWIHAVSVGEVIAALPILREVREELKDYEIVLSVTTSSGHRTAREQAGELVDHIVYFPIDLLRCQMAAMFRVRPSVLAIMETELWPNLLYEAETFGVRIMVINGRLSDRSSKRAPLLRGFYGWMLGMVNRVLVQTQGDADRFKDLGAKNVEIFGNSKFDQALEDSGDRDAVRKEFGLAPNDFVVVIGSTRGPEEEVFVLEALSDPALRDVKVIHAPRHLETVDGLIGKAAEAFGQIAQRSKGETGRYLVLDTYGELSRTYAAADIAIIGGGFENLGGQNLIQPLAQGIPVLHGPHMQNFKDITRTSLEAGASKVCNTPAELAAALIQLKNNPAERQQMGSKASEIIRQSAGASKRYAQAIAAEAEIYQSKLR